MPVLRSREAGAPESISSSPRTPPPLQPPSPAMSAVPPPSSLPPPPPPPSSASSPLPSEPPLDSSGSPPIPPPRRSLRLASYSRPAPSPPTAPPAGRSSRGRKRKARVGDPPCETEGTSFEPGGASDAPSAPLSHEVLGEDDLYTNLRSGSRVARKMATVEKRMQSGNQVSDVDSVEKSVETIDLKMEDVDEQRSDVQEEVEGNLSSGLNNEILQDSLENAFNQEHGALQTDVGKGNGKSIKINSSVGNKVTEKDPPMKHYLTRQQRQADKGKLPLESHHVKKDLDIAGLELGQANIKTEDVDTKRKYSAEEKGKSVLEYEKGQDISGEIDIASSEVELANAKAEYEESSLLASQSNLNMEVEPALKDYGYLFHTDDDKDISDSDGMLGSMKRRVNYRREAERAKALELAPKFAFFKEDSNIAEHEESEEDSDKEPGDMMPHANHEDWPGPFSTAMKIIEERAERLRARERTTSKGNEHTNVMIPWTPSRDKSYKSFGRNPPSLKNLTLKVLLDNAEAIQSLDAIPDVLKHRLILMLCSSRKITFSLLDLLVKSNPTELHLSDCSWATESQFEEIFSSCYLSNLKALQLDLCGRCMPDYLLRAKLAQSPNSLPLLTSVSLRGAYQLSDDGLNALASSAPSLRSINLSDCSLLTSLGIKNLAEKLEQVLEELYIDDCRHVDAMVILPALKKLKHLEVLSVADNLSVCNKFVRQLTAACGSNIRELILAGCQKLTDSSMKAIGEHCSTLCVIDIRSLNRLTDSGIQHLANGCRSLQKLQLRRNNFSDEAVAAFLEASGGSLIELTLNNVRKVANHTGLAISRRCYTSLRKLDLSFCREMTDEAAGLIVDSCPALEILKLFGCTQITDIFLDGHSNPRVKIIGLKGQLLSEIEIPDHF